MDVLLQWVPVDRAWNENTETPLCGLFGDSKSNALCLMLLEVPVLRTGLL